MGFFFFRRNPLSNSSLMRKQQKKESKWQWAFRVLLVVVSTAATVYFMPRPSGFDYDYAVGQPWRYGALYASQKFSIQMSDSALLAQQDSARRAFLPYFNRDSTVRPAMRSRLMKAEVNARDENRRKIRATRDPELRGYVFHVAQLLDSVYAVGLVPPEVYDSLKATGTEAVRIINRDNIARSVPFGRIFSTRTAYKYIMEQDTAYKETALSRLNINTFLEVSLSYDEEKSKEELDNLIRSLSTGVGFVMANERIVDRGEIVTRDTYLKLKSYEAMMRQQNSENEKLSSIVAGRTVMVLIVMVTLLSYLVMFRRDYLENPRAAILLFSLITLFCIAASLMVGHRFFHVMALPCCIVPIVIRVFLDSRTAFIFHVAMVLTISLTLSSPYEFIVLQLVAGMVAIQNLRELSQRSQIIRTSAVITVTYMVFYVAYELTIGTRLAALDRGVFVALAVNGILFLFSYPLLWLLEKSLGFISDVTLVELSNINTPLLQMMTEVAPGTFQHSMQVANLASEVAKKLRAKVQLVRTAALYHDIGKLERPVFFTENQAGGNPHTHLTPVKSAEVIIAHVTNGLALADKYNLPSVIKRFISTHHGRGKVKYFYITYKNQHPDEDIDESLFTYPGPNPATKEEAILMMCDSVEAASRSLPEYTEESISTLVDRIIDSQVADGFFTECDITFRDIAQAKQTLKERLKNIYHTRISYPELQN